MCQASPCLQTVRALPLSVAAITCLDDTIQIVALHGYQSFVEYAYAYSGMLAACYSCCYLQFELFNGAGYRLISLRARKHSL